MYKTAVRFYILILSFLLLCFYGCENNADYIRDIKDNVDTFLKEDLYESAQDNDIDYTVHSTIVEEKSENTNLYLKIIADEYAIAGASNEQLLSLCSDVLYNRLFCDRLYDVSKVFVYLNEKNAENDLWYISCAYSSDNPNFLSYSEHELVIEYPQNDENHIDNTEKDKNSFGSGATNNYGEENKNKAYVLNNGTKRIHLPDCSSVAKILDKNLGYTNNFNEMLNKGYKPCGICNPRQ